MGCDVAEQGRSSIGFVLVHGAELGAWVWDRLLPTLTRPVVAVDLPGRGDRPAVGRSVTSADAITAIVQDAGRCDAERIVLVVHSFSGVLAPGVIDRLGERVAAVVHVGASVPVTGQAWVDDLTAPQRLLLRTLYRFKPDGIRSPEGQNRSSLCHDLDDDATEAVLERRVPEPPRPLLEPVLAGSFPDHVAHHYVRLTEDRSASADDQRRAIDRLPGAEVHPLASGHLPMLSRPADLAAILEDAAVAAAGRTTAA